METYSRDQEYIIQATNLTSILKPKWKHRTSNNASKARKYFAELTKTQIKDLYQKYWLDFNLFNYTYEEYLEFGRDGRQS